MTAFTGAFARLDNAARQYMYPTAAAHLDSGLNCLSKQKTFR